MCKTSSRPCLCSIGDRPQVRENQHNLSHLNLLDVVGSKLYPEDIPAEWRNAEYLTQRTVGPKVLEKVGRELKILINRLTKPGTKNEVCLPKGWSVLKRYEHKLV